jgi:hypothetical protein
LICATGRSGSTTLQRILNTIPDTNICGENDNAILHLLNFYKSLKHRNIVNTKYSNFEKKNIKPCWYNYFDNKKMTAHVKEVIIQLLQGADKVTNIGWKEIRYDETNIHLLDELKELFPDIKIIVHIRNPETQCKSSWWGEDPEESKKILYKKNNLLVNYLSKNPTNTYLSVFKDLFDVEKIKKLFLFLGKEQYFDKNKIEKILNNNVETI